MDLFQVLYQFYEDHQDMVGVELSDQSILVPVYHMLRSYHIEIALSEHGTFLSARVLEKGKDAHTIVPVTEEFESATNNYVAPSLFGFLNALSGDFFDFCPDAKLESQNRHELYMNGLKDWINSPYSHPAVEIIYKYLSHDTMFSDLMLDGVIVQDDKGQFVCKSIKNLGKALVRFCIYWDSDKSSDIWMDCSLHDSFIQYYKSVLEQQRQPDLCCVTGQWTICADSFGIRIRDENDRLRLVSYNDTKGLTYLGRFRSVKEAFSVGSETIQKIYASLRFLIRKQGRVCYYNYKCGNTFLVWSNTNIKLPDVMSDSINGYNDIVDFGDLGFPEDDELQSVHTNKDLANRIVKASYGYMSEIDPNETFYVLVLDGVSRGRLSVCYYHAFGASDLVHNIQFWQKNCVADRWVTIRHNGKRQRTKCVHCPNPRSLVDCAYGVVSGDKDANRILLITNDNQLRHGLDVIHRCIVDCDFLPYDMVSAAVEQASRPMCVNRAFWDNELLMVAYAMFRYNYVRGGKDMSCFLEDNKENRDVLFGRIMAVLEKVQLRAYWRKHLRDNAHLDKKPRYEYRDTHIVKCWSEFLDMPALMMAEVQQNLLTYWSELPHWEIVYFERKIEELMLLLNACGGFHNQPLQEMYLAGYVEQRALMRAEYENNSAKNKNADGDVDEDTDCDVNMDDDVLTGCVAMDCDNDEV